MREWRPTKSIRVPGRGEIERLLDSSASIQFNALSSGSPSRAHYSQLPQSLHGPWLARLLAVDCGHLHLPGALSNPGPNPSFSDVNEWRGSGPATLVSR